ncbi:UPF0149 family protein [Paludibacterium paludis]|uniref:YecA family protein n=1 Tax=Paludibacterium paludis TaxID=1225769 RepID=A0A918P1D5_9NEIS|nr:UPF0149 family protein [Paludibacterium paludis]GGY12980.1 hypothetical protein GCM10011289_15190 [Paludibacterium paludis]
MQSLDSFTALSDAELDELGAFLISPAAPAGTMALDALDGFVTALVAGPVTVLPSVWLPRVWGEGFARAADAGVERAVELILRHANSRHAQLKSDAGAYRPILSEVTWRGRGYADGEAWAWGFLCGIGLVIERWQPLFDVPEALAALEPIHLLGSDELDEAEQEACKNPSRRAKLCERLTDSVERLWRFWEPYRGAVTTHRRDTPKTGRNEPCTCGSQRKFKRCCGA